MVGIYSNETERRRYGKEHIYIVELELDYCANTFGQAPCTATGAGDAKCVNTFDKCQDPENFTQTTKIYRFCEARSPHPIGIDAIPSLKSVNIAPTQIDLRGGLGVRASVSLSFTDHPGSDINIDPYVNERTYIASERGSFWTKLRARNPNYQNRPLRVLSGYLVDGVYDPDNFISRDYIVESLNVTSGQATIKGKDPLKLASEQKAQAPRPSTGKLNADITNTATSLTLIADTVDEYPASGKVLINSEVLSYTGKSGDDLTGLVRGENNTIADAHSAGDTVQLCLEYISQKVNVIVEDLLTTYANIESAFIPSAVWASEVDDWLTGTLTGIVVKPVDVNKLLKELAESMPHYLWWDERVSQIQLTALKAPQGGSPLLNMSDNIVANSFNTMDKPELRKSSIFVSFGQFDPTRKLDEFSNYQATYIRTDTGSITKYGRNEVQNILTRWISQDNEAAARQMAALIGRRFADIPREINFSLEPKDGNVWTGQVWDVNHRDMVDDSGLPIDTSFQIVSAKEADLFQYKALEFTYGDALPEDEGGGDPGVTTIFIPADSEDYNMRTAYEAQEGEAPTAATIAVFVLDNGRYCTGSTTGTHAIDTGGWPAGAQIQLKLNAGAVVGGKGGAGGSASTLFVTPGGNGGTAILLNYDLEIINNGIIGAGGGGGGAARDTVQTQNFVGGSGGASYGGAGQLGNDGQIVSGGSQETRNYSGGFVQNGAGGGLGENGGTASASSGDTSAPGSAGAAAINRNGFTLTQTLAGDIRGNIIN